MSFFALYPEAVVVKNNATPAFLRLERPRTILEKGTRAWASVPGSTGLCLQLLGQNLPVQVRSSLIFP